METSAAPRWRTVLDLGVLLLLIAPVGAVLAPAHWTSIWMDREFQGWMIAVANRLASGPPLYADGMHSPMPPLPFAIELLAGGGRGTWLTESVLNVVFQTLMLLGMYAALSACARWPIPLCATLAATPVIFAIHKTAIHDSVAQCWAAWATAAVLRGLAPGAAASRARWWLLGAGLLNALCLLSKQSTASGLTLGIVVAYLMADRARRVPQRLGRAAAHVGWTLGFAAVLALALSPLLTVRGLVEDVYLLGAEPKGGVAEALRSLARYARQAAPPLATYGWLALPLAWLARRARPAETGKAPAGSWSLMLASILTAAVILATALGPRALDPPAWQTPLRWVAYFYLNYDRVLWTGLCLGLVGTAWALWRPSRAGDETPWAAMILVLVPTALAHNLSTMYLRWTYDNNPLIVAALAWLARGVLAVFQQLGPRSRAVTSAAVGVAMQLGVWLTLEPQLAVARQCTEAWPEVAHLRGARLRPGADGMRQLVRILRELNGPDDQVLFLPEDPNVEAWLDRPRPALTSAIAFADQYWDRYVDEDVRRLTAAPPKTIVVGPRKSARGFARLFGHQRWGVARLSARVEQELLPQRYVLHVSHVIGFQGGRDRMDVYVRRDSP